MFWHRLRKSILYKGTVLRADKEEHLSHQAQDNLSIVCSHVMFVRSEIVAGAPKHGTFTDF